MSLTLAHPVRSERSGGPDFVSVAQHDGRCVEAATRLKRQSPLALAGALAIVDVVAAYRLFLARPGIHYDADLLYEEIARIYGWAGLLDRASATVAEGAAVMRRWPASVQEQLGGVQPWRDRVARAVAGQLQLRATADEQARLLGVGGVPVVELSV